MFDLTATSNKLSRKKRWKFKKSNRTKWETFWYIFKRNTFVSAKICLFSECFWSNKNSFLPKKRVVFLFRRHELIWTIHKYHGHWLWIEKKRRRRWFISIMSKTMPPNGQRGNRYSFYEQKWQPNYNIIRLRLVWSATHFGDTVN